ncbi:MAG TPA: transcription antitermination factor NusB [Myxococcota bacterium]|nr:transcription antitermination factor NusB [Myxococcota bacterium]HNZ02656.1 transcription antitermination factor NusB [Myxococcota bacterium]
MGTRRRGRECALQLMYMWEYNRAGRFDTDAFWMELPQEERATRQFAERLVEGVTGNLEHIDTLIKDASTNWRLDRMANVDRNILRLATWELENIAETPLKVVLNEAIELSKRFGSEDSSAFVNGVLDRIGSMLRPGTTKGHEVEDAAIAGAAPLEEGDARTEQPG